MNYSKASYIRWEIFSALPHTLSVPQRAFHAGFPCQINRRLEYSHEREFTHMADFRSGFIVKGRPLYSPNDQVKREGTTDARVYAILTRPYAR